MSNKRSSRAKGIIIEAVVTKGVIIEVVLTISLS